MSLSASKRNFLCLKRGTWLIYVINIKSRKNKKPHYSHSLKYKITNDQKIKLISLQKKQHIVSCRRNAVFYLFLSFSNAKTLNALV